jgi:hypothetical protein
VGKGLPLVDNGELRDQTIRRPEVGKPDVMVRAQVRSLRLIRD